MVTEPTVAFPLADGVDGEGADRLSMRSRAPTWAAVFPAESGWRLPGAPEAPASVAEGWKTTRATALTPMDRPTAGSERGMRTTTASRGRGPARRSHETL